MVFKSCVNILELKTQPRNCRRVGSEEISTQEQNFSTPEHEILTIIKAMFSGFNTWNNSLLIMEFGILNMETPEHFLNPEQKFKTCSAVGKMLRRVPVCSRPIFSAIEVLCRWR